MISAFLPPSSHTTFFMWRWPGCGDGRDLVDLEADGLRAGERDDGDVGVLDQPGADVLAEPGQELEHPGRRAGREQRLGQPPGHAGGLLGRLEDHRVAGGQRGHGHPARDGEREVPRRDDRGDALALVGHAVRLARGRLHEVGGGRRQAQHLAPVVLAEVDRLAHVAVGLVPRLGRLEALEGGQLVATLAHPVGRPEQERRLARLAGVRRHAGRRRDRGRDGRVGVGRGARRRGGDDHGRSGPGRPR